MTPVFRYLPLPHVCSVTPVFVQVHQKWRQVYVGVAECGDVRVDYHMIHLRHTPTHFGHLSGLLELFKAKLVTQQFCHNFSSVGPITLIL